MRFRLSIEFSLKDPKPVEGPEVVIENGGIAITEHATKAIEHELKQRPVGFGTY